MQSGEEKDEEELERLTMADRQTDSLRQLDKQIQR